MKNIYKQIFEKVKNENHGLYEPYRLFFAKILNEEYMSINANSSVVEMIEEKSGLNSLIGLIKEPLSEIELELKEIEKKYADFSEVVDSVLWDSV